MGGAEGGNVEILDQHRGPVQASCGKTLFYSPRRVPETLRTGGPISLKTLYSPLVCHLSVAHYLG